MLTTFFASLLIWVMIGGLVLLWVIDGRVKKEEALHAAFSSISAWIISKMVKDIFPVSRPFVSNGDAVSTVTIPQDGAFPSSHTAIAFAIATTIWLHNRRLGFWFFLAAVLTGLGRVLANVHFPTDVIGGAVLGVVTALIFDKLHVFKLVGK